MVKGVYNFYTLVHFYIVKPYKGGTSVISSAADSY